MKVKVKYKIKYLPKRKIQFWNKYSIKAVEGTILLLELILIKKKEVIFLQLWLGIENVGTFVQLE